MANRQYALIVGEDVFAVIHVDDDPEINQNGPRISAGLSSNPIVVEIDTSIPVSHGWTWDGTTVNPPQE